MLTPGDQPGTKVKPLVVFVAKRFHTNEAVLLRSLIARGIRIEYIVHESSHSENHADVTPTVVGYLGKVLKNRKDSDRLRFGIYPPRAFRMILTSRPDVVVIKGFRLASLLLAVVLRIAGIEVVLSVQRPLRENALKARTRAVHGLFARHVITPVLGSRQLPQRQSAWPHQVWYYVPFVARVPAAARKRVYFEGGVVNVLIVAKLAARKRVVQTLDVLDELYERSVPFRVTIIGTVLEVDVYEAVRRRVERTEYLSMEIDVPHSDMEARFLSHDVLILPSVREVAAVSHLEAMSCGLAVVCSDDNGTADYVVDGETGIIFAIESFHRSLRNALVSLLEDRKGILRLGEAAMNVVDRDHGVENFLAILAARGVDVTQRG